MTTRIYSIFADDIRTEIGNKHSYMGVYVQNLNVTQFPATVQKLCVATHIQCDRDFDLKTLSLSVFLGENIIDRQDVPPEAVAQLINNRKKRDPELEEDLYFVMNLVIEQLNLAKPGVVSIIVTLNGEAFDAGKVWIRIAQP